MNFFKSLKNAFFGKAGESTPGTPDSGSSTFQPSATTATRAAKPEPVLQDAGYRAPGGVQGLTWYTSALKQDDEGDFADEFFEEKIDGSGKAVVAKSTVPTGAPVCQVHSIHQGNVIVKPS